MRSNASVCETCHTDPTGGGVAGDVELFTIITLGQFQSPFVRIPNTNQQQLDDPAETARPPPNRLESAGVTTANWDNSRSSLQSLSTK